ncbi:recombinase family protein [Peribacillus sp. Hz7]|uniref:recombinase family protein n=1 Tax=Peribacillus sp. Hz7 TaxID=3344873 RepID=UPI0035CAC3B7
MKTVAYYRNSISIEKQKLSIEMQKQSIHEIAKKNHLIIDHEFEDRETSARKTGLEERIQMKLLMDDIKKGMVKNLIVYSRCRLARNVQQYMSLFELLKQHTVNVIFAADFEFPMMFTIESEFIERILAAMNEVDANQLVQKLQDAKMTKAKGGKHAAGAIPFGYRKAYEEIEKDGKNEEWKKVESEWKDIELIYDAFLQEDFNSLQKFVDHINEKGMRFRKGKEWNYQRIKRVLTNPIYKGERIFHSKDELIVRTVQDLKIIDEPTWGKVQRKMNEIIKVRDKDEKNKEEIIYLLNGLVYCSECNQMMSGKTHKLNSESTLVYKCKTHSTIRTSRDWLENTVIQNSNDYFNEIVKANFAEVIEKMYKRQASEFIETIGQINRELKQLEKTMVERTELALEKGEEVNLDQSMIQTLEKYEQSQFIWSELNYKIFEIKEKFVKVNEWKEEAFLQIIQDDMGDQEKIELLQDIVYRIQLSKEQVIIVFQHPLFTGVKGSVEIGLI